MGHPDRPRRRKAEVAQHPLPRARLAGAGRLEGVELQAAGDQDACRIGARGAVHHRREDEALGCGKTRRGERREPLRLAADEARCGGGDIGEADHMRIPGGHDSRECNLWRLRGI